MTSSLLDMFASLIIELDTYILFNIKIAYVCVQSVSCKLYELLDCQREGFPESLL